MQRVTTVRALDNYRLAVAFDDGVEGVVSLETRLFGPVFEPLQNPFEFSRVFVDEFGAVCWPNGADLAPDALYEQVQTAAVTQK